MAQWLRLQVPNARNLGLIPGQGLSSRMPCGRDKKKKKNVSKELVYTYDHDSTDKLISKRVNCRIPDDYYEQLQELAKEYELGISEMLRIALNMYFYNLIKTDSVVATELENDFRQLLEKAGIN